MGDVPRCDVDGIDIGIGGELLIGAMAVRDPKGVAVLGRSAPRAGTHGPELGIGQMR
jgi:hypothetical protein